MTSDLRGGADPRIEMKPTDEETMPRLIALLVSALWANLAAAQSCPDFYRFVDFGLESSDGVIHRGGPVFRAETLEGEPLLVMPETNCIQVRDISADGHGNPMPVVTSFNYDPQKFGVSLVSLQISKVADAKAAAADSALPHQQDLAGGQMTATQGADFLCASPKAADRISCQVVSPYPGNAALVVYCDAAQCRMPALAVGERILVSAIWANEASSLNAPEDAGKRIITKVQKIHDQLEPLSSSLYLR